MKYNCPYCRGTGRFTEPGRLPGDPTVTEQCWCQSATSEKRLKQNEAEAREYADTQMMKNEDKSNE